MESLLYGQIIDTLKCLDFNQLFALKQTNKYFKTLIGRYEHLLTRKEFKRIHIVIVNEEEQKNYKIIDLGIGVFNLKLNNKVEEKWQSAIDKEIPVYLNTDEYPLNSKEIVIELNIGEDRESENILILKLPVFPKNIEEMKIIYCWLFHLFNYAYCDAEFFTFIFNPEFIQLLFEENNEENIQTKLNIKNVFLNLNNSNNESVLKFIMEHLITLNLVFFDNTEAYNDILFKLLLNGGNIIYKICILELSRPTLHNLIIKNLEESKDCSKIVAKIFINFKDCPRINLIIRAEDIKKAQKGDRHYIKYELSNIYNPNVRYSIINVEENGLMKNVIIQRINLFLNYFV
ncbi:hypothetical protein ACQ4LE_006142 [Meloidogyne hapla]